MKAGATISEQDIVLKDPGWHADLQLGFSYQRQRTIISHKQFKGPLTIQKPFYPEQDVCHTYLLHPPGGIVGGDRLDLTLQLDPGAHALVTTPAANKFYRSSGAAARINQTLRVDDSASLEFLPQESILFNASNSHLHSQLHLTGNARIICWDIVCLGRPAGNAGFKQGQCQQRMDVIHDEQPVLTDRLRFNGDSRLLNANWGFNGCTTFAYMIASPVSAEMLHALKSNIAFGVQEQLSASLVKNLLICRYLGYHAEQAKQKFIRVWEQLRPMLMNKPACPPRIWRT